MDLKLQNNPFYDEAMRYIESHDLCNMAPGRHIIDGDNLFVTIVDSQMKTIQQARYEVHNDYIDIQVPLSKEETFGIKPREECKDPDGDFNSVKDIQFFKDTIDKTITVKAGESVTFAPDTAHAPLIGEGTIRKAIFKVRVPR